MPPKHRPRGAPEVPPDLPPEYVDAYLEGYRRAYDPGVSGEVYEQGGAPVEESESPEAQPPAAVQDQVEAPVEEPAQVEEPEDDWPDLVPGMRAYGQPSGLGPSVAPTRPTRRPLERGERPLWVLMALITVIVAILMLAAYALGRVLSGAIAPSADPGGSVVSTTHVSP